MKTKNSLTIIIPCFNEYKNIELFSKSVETLNLNCKLLYIDDGSTDNTWEKIKKLSTINSKIEGIRLARNFGKNAAILAGLSNQSSDFVIIIDADLQHPIEKIPEMINFYNKGYKIISTVRNSDEEGFFRELGSKCFYSLMRNFSDLKFFLRTTDFMLIDKEIINYFLNIKEKDRNIKNFIYWSGFKKKEIEINIVKRKYEKSKFNFYKLFKLAINTFSSFSLFPLKLIGYLGLILSFFSSALLIYSFVGNIFNFFEVTVQTMIILFNSFFTGIIMIAIGLLAIYVARMDSQLMSRPNYIISDKILN